MKTRIEEMERYVPDVNDVFTYDCALKDSALIRIPDEQGIKIFSLINNKPSIYSLDLDTGEIGYLSQDEHTFIPLEPLGGEIVFRVKR